MCFFEQRDQAIIVLSQEVEQPFHSVSHIPCAFFCYEEFPDCSKDASLAALVAYILEAVGSIQSAYELVPQTAISFGKYVSIAFASKAAKQQSRPEALAFLLGLAGSNVSICLGPQRLGCLRRHWRLQEGSP